MTPRKRHHFGRCLACIVDALPLKRHSAAFWPKRCNRSLMLWYLLCEFVSKRCRRAYGLQHLPCHVDSTDFNFTYRETHATHSIPLAVRAETVKRETLGYVRCRGYTLSFCDLLEHSRPAQEECFALCNDLLETKTVLMKSSKSCCLWQLFGRSVSKSTSELVTMLLWAQILNSCSY